MVYIARLDVSENRPTTHCKHCVFAVKNSDGDEQIGCLSDRISAFKKSGTSVVTTTEDNQSYYTVGGLCNLFRDESWKHYEEAKNVGLFDREDIYLSKAKQEISTSFGFVIYDSEEECEKLKQTVHSVGLSYPKNKVKIVISATGRKKNIADYIELVESFIQKGWKIELVINSEESPKHVRDLDAFGKCAHLDYLAYCDSGAILTESTLEKINSALNYKLEKIITFSQKSLFGPISFIMKSIASSEYLEHNDFQKMFENVKDQCLSNNMHKEL